MIELRARTVQQVREEWGWVRNGLLTIIERTRESWLPEDVWQSLQGGHSFLWVVHKNGDDIGFLVLRKDADPDGPVLYLWIAWAEPQALADCHAELIERLDEIAARIGARRLRFESPRAGWRGFDNYFDAVRTVFEREVTHV